MAKKKISGLPAGSALNGTELVPIVQTGTTKRITTQDIANLGNSSGVEGSGTINTLAKFTASSTIGNSQIFDNGTSVGIGTASPARKLTIQGDDDATMQLRLQGTASTTSYWELGRESLSSGQFRFIASRNGTIITPMAIGDVTGNVLIGTTTDAGYKLDVNGTARVSADATINGVKVGRGAGNFADNTAVGASALASNTSGLYNTALGNTALGSNSTGSQNVSVGGFALAQNTSGSLNVAIGESAMRLGNTGSSNTAIGTLALYANTASNNTAVGFEAGYSNTSGTGITAIGDRALRASTGNYNTAVGAISLFSNTTGNSNTSIGNSCLVSNTTGSNNTAIGLQSLGYNTTGSNNVAIGRDTLFNNTASNNTAVGYEAATNNTSGLNLTAIGYRAAKANTTANNNTAIGNEALVATTTGASNTAIGYFALASNTTGATNTAIGENVQSGNFSGSIILGADAIATANNQFVVGSAGINAGSVATEANLSSKVWNVRINGVAQKILLA